MTNTTHLLPDSHTILGHALVKEKCLIYHCSILLLSFVPFFFSNNDKLISSSARQPKSENASFAKDH